MGSSFNFDGVSDDINYGDLTPFDNITAFTFTGWVRFNDVTKTNQAIFSKSWSVPKQRFYLYIDAGRNFEFNVNDDNAGADRRHIEEWQGWIAGTSNNIWYHYAWTWSASANDMKLYVDGVEKTLVVVNAGAVAALSADADPFVVGDFGTSNSFELDGKMAYLRLFDRVLSQNEVLEIMHTPDAIVNGLVFGPNLTNSSAKDPVTGVTPTINGATLDSAGPPVYFKNLKINQG